MLFVRIKRGPQRASVTVTCIRWSPSWRTWKLFCTDCRAFQDMLDEKISERERSRIAPTDVCFRTNMTAPKGEDMRWWTMSKPLPRGEFVQFWHTRRILTVAKSRLLLAKSLLILPFYHLRVIGRNRCRRMKRRVWQSCPLR